MADSLSLFPPTSRMWFVGRLRKEDKGASSCRVCGNLEIIHSGDGPMEIRFHPHALLRMEERGTTEREVRHTIERGEGFPAKFGRVGFRQNFPFHGQWRGRQYGIKQVEAFVVHDEDGWLVISVITKYF